MQKTVLYFAALLCICNVVAVNAQKLELMKHLPEKYQAYKAAQWLDFTGEALFDYINGGAELYMSYGLVGMTGCKYSAEGLPQITVEVYEMTEAKNAFGVYTQNRDRVETDYGQGSQSFNDFILFWKDRYFVTVSSQRSTPESAATLKELAALVDRAIAGRGEVPAIVSELPKDGLTEAGFIYFHHYIWLNAYFFIADFNIANITPQTDAILAKYGPADGRCYLLMVNYPDNAAASEAAQQLLSRYAPEWTPDKPYVEMEDGTWFALKLEGTKLAAIFNGASKAQVDELYKSLYK